MRDPFDGQVSVVEELDPEPVSGSRWIHLREVVLGLLLVTAVLAWGGWDWWHQDYSQTTYRIAQEAASSQDWDNAFLYFSKVPGYKDATARAAEMDKLVKERNKQYDIASSASEKGEWAATLQAAQAVRRIQKNYRDSSQLEVDSAVQVYRGALEGSVALRTQARKAALYYRDADGWQWLARSDKFSRVLPKLDTSSAIVYDAPGEGWDEVKLTPSPTPNLDTMVAGAPELKGRRLMVARHDGGEVTFVPVNLDPTLYNFYWVGEKGIWAFRLDYANIRNRRQRVTMGFEGIQVAYQAFGSPNVVDVAVQPGWVSMDFAPDGEHILLVDQGPSSNAEQPLKLYLADGTGNNKTLLYTHPGNFQGVQFSPDSKHALLTTYYHNKQEDSEIYEALLLDLSSNTQHSLVKKTLKYKSQRTEFPLLIAGTFIREGTFAGFPLITDNSVKPGRLRLFAPDNPAYKVLDLEVGEAPIGAAWSSQKDESTIIIWQESTMNDAGGSPLAVLEIRQDLSANEAIVPLTKEGFVDYAGIKGKWLVYSSSAYAGGGGKANPFTAFALPLSDLGQEDKKPSTTYETRISSAARWSSGQMYKGTTMFSYANNGELHARTYDGSVDITLENGVLDLYDKSPWLQVR